MNQVTAATSSPTRTRNHSAFSMTPPSMPRIERRQLGLVVVVVQQRGRYVRRVRAGPSESAGFFQRGSEIRLERVHHPLEREPSARRGGEQRLLDGLRQDLGGFVG